MASPIETIFVGYLFDEQEEIAAKTFTDLQMKHLQTELALCASEKIKIQMIGDLQEIARQHAYLEGKMASLENLIMIHTNFVDRAQEKILEQVRTERSENDRSWGEAYYERSATAIREAFAVSDALASSPQSSPTTIHN